MELKARQRLGAFLLRHGRVYEDKARWTQAHSRWLEQQRFDLAVQQTVFQEYVDAVVAAVKRTDGIKAQMHETLRTWSQRPTAEALMSLRGVSTITAMTTGTRSFPAIRSASSPGCSNLAPSCSPSYSGSSSGVTRGRRRRRRNAGPNATRRTCRTCRTCGRKDDPFPRPNVGQGLCRRSMAACRADAGRQRVARPLPAMRRSASHSR